MVNILKFNKENSSKLFFISDLHIKHSKLLESRGFSTIEEHDNTIIENWNKVVDNDSTVFMLGDMVLGAGEKSKEVYLNLLYKLNYKTIYICQGNHGAAYKGLWNEAHEKENIDKFYRLHYQLQTSDKTVYFIPNYYEIFVGNQPIILSHYSILSWNGVRANSWMIFGHSHNSLEKTHWIRNNYLIGKCLDVSWEHFREPISFDKLKEIMDARVAIVVDHH